MQTMTEVTAEQAANEIRRAWGTWTSQYGCDGDTWMSVGTLAERVDLNHEQISLGIRHLASTDRRFAVADQPYSGLRTPRDEEYAVWAGGRWNHIFAWD